jgi:hypothetical protein
VYQTSAYPFYPGLVTFSQFEAALFAFLDQRANASRGNELTALDDVDPSWLALLFAVLAGGVQFSDDPIKERDLRSKVFSVCSEIFEVMSYVREDPQLMLGVVCSSFQCLRISNFFNNTDMNQIQAMALIGHCLRNNLDTNSAWILMGRCFVTRDTPIIMVANHKSRRYYAPCTEYRTPRREFLSRILSRPLPPQKTLVYPHPYQPLSTLLQTFES